MMKTHIIVIEERQLIKTLDFWEKIKQLPQNLRSFQGIVGGEFC